LTTKVKKFLYWQLDIAAKCIVNLIIRGNFLSTNNIQ
jgi:hypothetical protein